MGEHEDTHTRSNALLFSARTFFVESCLGERKGDVVRSNRENLKPKSSARITVYRNSSTTLCRQVCRTLDLGFEHGGGVVRLERRNRGRYGLGGRTSGEF